MRAAPTETICLGETSIIWTSAGDTNEISVVAPKNTSRSSCNLRSDSDAACGDDGAGSGVPWLTCPDPVGTAHPAWIAQFLKLLGTTITH